MTSFNRANLENYVQAIAHIGIATIPNFLKKKSRQDLLSELTKYNLRPAPLVVGDRKVRQAYEGLSVFASDSLFPPLKQELEDWLNSEFSRMDTKYLSGDTLDTLKFNRIKVQRYNSGSSGISPHRDGASLIDLIAILILEGTGRFCLCDDREGSNPRPIRNEPGDLLLMRGVGFHGSLEQPLHFLDNIKSRRTTVAFRSKNP